MRILRFLLLIFFWIVCFLSVIAVYFYQSPELFLKDAGGKISFLSFFLRKGVSYFRYSGSWNYVITIFIFCGSTLVFSIIDLALEKIFHSRDRSTSIYSFGFRWIGQRISAAIITILVLTSLANLTIVMYSSTRIYSSTEKVPDKQVILLLGTNKKLREGGGENLYYTYRINAVSELYRAGKVGHIVISGDRTESQHYNEPLDMMRDLVRKGIPEAMITLDYAGYRTLDSIVRLRNIFKVKKAVIVSQTFHLERAMVLSWFYNIESIGFAADGSMTDDMKARELLAKPKALLDVFVFNMQPREGKAYVKSSVDWDSGNDVTFVYWTGLLLLFTTIVLIFTFTKEK